MLTRLGLIAAAVLCGTMAFASYADAGSRMKFRYYNYDPDYDYYYGPEYLPEPNYQPEYVPPRKRKTYARPQSQLPSRPQAAKKTQAAKQKPTSISCAKAGQIVSGYGFKSVETVTCKGQVYAFNATRDGKPFAVKLNSASGELTEVKKR
jgi:hypothetical protein